MSKQSFESLLDKYLSGNCSLEERRLVESWFDLLGSDAQMPQSEVEWNQTKKKIWTQVTQQTSIQERSFTPIWNNLFVRSVAAACILLLVGLGFTYWAGVAESKNAYFQKEMLAQMVTKENQTKQVQVIRLEDGTTIHLYPNASLKYPSRFDSKVREVVLVGNAFFEVAKNPNKPFLILTGNTITKVLGTSFLIKSEENRKVEVAVKTDQVTVFQNHVDELKEPTVVLTPNQKVVYEADEKVFETGIVEQPVVLATAKELVRFDFQKVKMKEVIAVLEKAYGLKISVENPAMLSCYFTGDLNNMDLYTQLDFMCQSLSASYQPFGTSIRISGNGCN